MRVETNINSSRVDRTRRRDNVTIMSHYRHSGRVLLALKLLLRAVSIPILPSHGALLALSPLVSAHLPLVGPSPHRIHQENLTFT